MSEPRWAEPPADPAPISEVADLVVLVHAGAALLDAGDVPAGLDPLAPHLVAEPLAGPEDEGV